MALRENSSMKKIKSGSKLKNVRKIEFNVDQGEGMSMHLNRFVIKTEQA